MSRPLEVPQRKQEQYHNMPNDFLFDENMEPLIEDGDFVIGESTYQHQQFLLLAEKGDYKQFPTAGVASKRYLEREKPDDYARAIRQEFISDGMKVKTLNIAQDLQISIDAEYLK